MDRFGDKVCCNPAVKLKKQETYPLIDIDKITPGYKTVRSVEQVEYTGQSGAKFKDHDILFARITPCLENGKVAIADTDGKNGTGSTELFVFRGIEGISDTDYIYYLLNMKHIRQLAANSMTGASGRQRADLGFIKRIQWNFPEIDMQKQIGSILSAYDNLIELNNKRIKILEQMAENLYKEWFVRFRFPGYQTTEFENGIPKGWKLSTLGKEVRFVNGRAYLMPELQDEGKYRIVRVGNFSGKDEWFYSDMELDEEKYCEQGDLLYKWSCNFGPEIWNEEKVIYHYHIWKVLVGEQLNKIYLYHFLTHSTQLWIGGTNGTSMAHITKESMEKKKILVPSEKVLQTFETYSQNYMQQILSLKKQNNNLIEQRDLLLPRLMSGKLEV